MASVPRRYPGSTIVCIGGGPSLTAADVDGCRGKAVVIAVNDAYRLAPWAEALYACDAKWWMAHNGVPGFAGAKWSLDTPNWATLRNRLTDVQLLENTGAQGLEPSPTGLRTGKNSGYQAINLAVHYGAQRILLLGYDMQPARSGQSHWFGEHPHPIRTVSPYPYFLGMFDSLRDPLRELQIEVINCSRETALTCFPRQPLAAALQASAVAA